MMAFSVKLTVKKRRGIDPRELVRRRAAAVIGYLRESLINGYRPADGEARPRKADGKPLGFDTGRLARGLRMSSLQSTRTRASVRIMPPASRSMLAEPTGEDGLSFLARHQILTVDGLARELLDEATADYLKEINTDDRP